MKPLAVVTGVGPGVGSAVVERFQRGGYRLAMIARTKSRLLKLEWDLSDAWAVPCDVTDTAAFGAALTEIEAREGAPSVVVHNAVGGAFGTFLDIDPAVLDRNFQVNVMAFLQLARWAAPLMEAAGHGAIVTTGNTSALRGKAGFAGFAPTKAAQRILAESIARAMGPRGVHVGYLVIDAVIDLEWTRAHYKDKPDDFFTRPEDIAEEIWRIAHQPKGAWSFLSEVRPYGEAW